MTPHNELFARWTGGVYPAEIAAALTPCRLSDRLRRLLAVASLRELVADAARAGLDSTATPDGRPLSAHLAPVLAALDDHADTEAAGADPQIREDSFVRLDRAAAVARLAVWYGDRPAGPAADVGPLVALSLVVLTSRLVNCRRCTVPFLAGWVEDVRRHMSQSTLFGPHYPQLSTWRIVCLQGNVLCDFVDPGWRFDRRWRTTTAVQLARAMYEARDFSAMPILADALQDAGCTEELVLAELRRPRDRDAERFPAGGWFRGTRVIDELLGKRLPGLATKVVRYA